MAILPDSVGNIANFQCRALWVVLLACLNEELRSELKFTRKSNFLPLFEWGMGASSGVGNALSWPTSDDRHPVT
jgi:hypothetical protein